MEERERERERDLYLINSKESPLASVTAMERSGEAYVLELPSPLPMTRARCRRARAFGGRNRPVQRSNKLIRSAVPLLHRAGLCYDDVVYWYSIQ
jgi:hypothetical protein